MRLSDVLIVNWRDYLRLRESGGLVALQGVSRVTRDIMTRGSRLCATRLV